MGSRPSGEGENEGADEALGPPGQRDSSGPAAGPVTGTASSQKKVGTSAVPASRRQRRKGMGFLSVPRSLSLISSIR